MCFQALFRDICQQALLAKQAVLICAVVKVANYNAVCTAQLQHCYGVSQLIGRTATAELLTFEIRVSEQLLVEATKSSTVIYAIHMGTQSPRA